MASLSCFLCFIGVLVNLACANVQYEVKIDEKVKRTHQIDSLNILAYVSLLILTVCTIWFLKLRRARFLHETGLAIIYGLIVGAIIRYAGDTSEVGHIPVVPERGVDRNISVPPDNLFFVVEVSSTGTGSIPKKENKTYAYNFRGEVTDVKGQILDQKATFDPEIFFNIILPPIIFNAGYSLKRKFFFRNLGTIMTYAFLGTTISTFVFGGVMFAFVQLMRKLANEFSFNDCLYFGAIISATDPVTVLAIFNDLHVDVNLYALVFGESILNDAVAIVLSGAISNYAEQSQEVGGFQTQAAFKSVGNFAYIFVCSFFIGSVTGCLTAALTKFTRLCNFPLLESSLFVLMSYSTFLMAEAADLTGIVAVLFCGICQAHYTYNNLSSESRARTKQLFELLNFIAESFIFCYIGVSMFTYRKHHWDVGFIVSAFIAIAVGRALNIYPLSFLLNFGRQNKIPLNFQHVLFFSGLRGALAFALAIRNTMSESRHLILTATSIIAIVTVMLCGGLTTQLLAWLGIPVGVEEEHEMLQFGGVRTVYNTVEIDRTSQVTTPTDLRSPPPTQPQKTPYEKAWLVKKWYNFDIRYMKPLLTHSRPTLMDTMPSCCISLARLLTSTQQLSQDDGTKRDDDDSDTDLCIDESELTYADRTNGHPGVSRSNSAIEGDLGLAGRLAEVPNSRVRIPGPTGDFV